MAPANKVIYETLEIRQTGVQDPIFIVRSPKGIVAKDENNVTRTFLPSGFQFTLPPENEEGFRSLNIAVDNIDRVASRFAEAAMAEEVPVEVVFRPYVSDNLEVPQMNPPLVLYLKDIQITSYQVTGRATFIDLVNRKFPTELYTRKRFPALG